MAKLRGRQRAVGGTLVLDAEGLVKLANGNPLAMSLARDTHSADAQIVTAATTLAEVLRGGSADASLHRVLSRIAIFPIGAQEGRAAGKLLGQTGLSGHRCALDALLAVVALAQPRPAILLTSDPKDLARLTEEPLCPRGQRIQVVRA